MLNTLEANDPGGLHHCVRLKEWFEYRHHVCMVFERLGLSLYDFLRKNSYKPFHIELVRPLPSPFTSHTWFIVGGFWPAGLILGQSCPTLCPKSGVWTPLCKQLQALPPCAGPPPAVTVHSILIFVCFSQQGCFWQVPA